MPLRIIAVDTVPASGLLEDENDNTEITLMMKERLGRLAETYQCLVIGLVHPPKSGGPDPRGGGAFRGSADYVLHVERVGSAKTRRLELTKARDSAERILGGFTLDVVQVGTDEKDRPITTCVVDASTEAPRRRAPRYYAEFLRELHNGQHKTRASLRGELPDMTDEVFDICLTYGRGFDFQEEEDGNIVIAGVQFGS